MQKYINKKMGENFGYFSIKRVEKEKEKNTKFVKKIKFSIYIKPLFHKTCKHIIVHLLYNFEKERLGSKP